MPRSYQALVWLGTAWLGLAYFAMVGLRFGLEWFGIHVKLNYQVSLLTLGGLFRFCKRQIHCSALQIPVNKIKVSNL